MHGELNVTVTGLLEYRELLVFVSTTLSVNPAAPPDATVLVEVRLGKEMAPLAKPVPVPLPSAYTGVGGAEMTGTVTVEVSLPVPMVTVMVRVVEFPPVVSVAFAVPVASVVPWVTCSAPEEAEKVTGTPDNTLLAASWANAEMTAVVDPSLSSDVALLLAVRLATAVVAAVEPLVTATLMVAVSVPEVAVTVMVLGLESPAVDKVARAEPVASVVP
jgi:hypothetical protein